MLSTNDQTTDQGTFRTRSLPPDDDIKALPWNIWYRNALEEGLNPELAGIGREAMRGACLKSWLPDIRYLTNFNLMTRLGREAPDLARRLWELLLETEGLTWISGADDGTEHGIIDFRIPAAHAQR